MKTFSFYEAIELVLTKGKRMRRSSWAYGNCLFFINSDILCTTYIMKETPTTYETYIPTPDDIISNDWLEVIQ